MPPAVVYFFCNCMSLPACLGEFFLFQIAIWPFFSWRGVGGGVSGGGGGGRNCPFGSLLVEF